MVDPLQPVLDFLARFNAALGIKTEIDVEQAADGPRLNLSGEQAELLVRHRGEPLKALQHVVDMAFGRKFSGEQRLFVDALAYRKGKDLELREMAKLVADKVKQTGARSTTRAAQSLRATHRAHCRRRSCWRDDGEHRGRVLEDRPDLTSKVAFRS